MRMLDLFCGRWGWSKSFAMRGWECIGVDLVRPSEIPERCTFVQRDILDISNIEDLDWNILESDLLGFDFVCASPPCEQFSVHGMKHFHPNAPYPEVGVRLFRHTETICERAGIPYVIENVRAAQQFVGIAAHHCGPFYLWGSGVPALLHKDIRKMMRGNGTAYRGFKDLPIEERRRARNEHQRKYPLNKRESASLIATIPAELAGCVADYAERLIEQRAMVR